MTDLKCSYCGKTFKGVIFNPAYMIVWEEHVEHTGTVQRARPACTQCREERK
jgi:ribosomal protein L37AE/L43A